MLEALNNSETLLTLLGILILLGISGFFSGSETSMTAASKARMHTLEEDGDKRAALVNSLWAKKERLIGSILLGNNLVNILASSLATSVLIALFGEAGIVYATLVMTALVLIFAEVLPKTYALRNPEKAALFASVVLRPIVLLLGPIVVAVEKIVHTTLRVLAPEDRNGSNDEASAAEEELRGAIALHDGEDEETRHEREMLRSILDLDDVTIEEIMTHRQKVESVEVDLPPEEIIKEVLSSPYTRIPLWQERPDNIVGVLHAKALLRALQAHRTDPERNDSLLDNTGLLSIAATPWFIPESTSLLAQLQAFRDRREHFAIVVDEYGEMQGIVTLEDILEEIVGDISDEHDEEMEGVHHLPDGSLEVDGTVTIRDLNRKFEWKLPDDEASTIAGLVLFEARQIPRVGQHFDFFGKHFEILERKRHQITRLRIENAQPPETADEE
ncbi:HlyC/CorC family transporter [Kiloniella sp. b19]|uniref:HlyC/CorC family transporter n=1 Tax=Kiloniella sp. GXU_MW_B19 TaxID=3141326 RepID=UPI0031E071D0